MNLPLFEKKMIVIVPSRNFKYSGIYNVSNDLHTGLVKEKIDHEMVLVILDKSYAEPEFSVTKIPLSSLNKLFSLDKVFLIPDDYRLIDYLYDKKVYDQNVLIWCHYFQGHRLLFSEYNTKIKNKNLFEYAVSLLFNFLPRSIWKFFVHKYVYYLKNNLLIAQSVWSCLLLNRVFNLNCQSVINLPVDLKHFPNNKASDKKVLIFIGGKTDTDLQKLNHALHVINGIVQDVEYYAIGDKGAYEIFAQTYKYRFNFLENITREKLYDLIAKMAFTINPVFLGTFEMFPIESLLCGTPVITFIQPFMEVVGKTKLISSIHSDNDIIYKVKYWLYENIDDERTEIKRRIKSKMENNKIAREIFQLIRDEYP